MSFLKRYAAEVGKQIDETRLLEQLVNQKTWPGVEEEVTFLRLRHSLAKANSLAQDGNSSDEDPSSTPPPQHDSEGLLCAVAARRRAGKAAATMLHNAPSGNNFDFLNTKQF